MKSLIIAGQVSLMVCGVVGLVDILFCDGKIGVWLAQYTSITRLFK